MVALVQLTDVVLHITDVEGGRRHGHPQALFLLSQDGLVEAVLLQVVHGQLTAAQLGHHVVGTAGIKDQPHAEGSLSRLSAAGEPHNPFTSFFANLALRVQR